MQIDTLYLPIRDFWMVVLNTNLPYLFTDPIFYGVCCHWHRGTSHICDPHLRELLLCCRWCHHPSSLPSTWPFGSSSTSNMDPPSIQNLESCNFQKGGFSFLRKVHNFFLALSHPNWSNKIVWLKLGNLLNIYRGLTAVVLGQFRQIWHLNSIDNMSSTWVLWDHQEFVACQRAWNSIHPPQKKNEHGWRFGKCIDPYKYGFFR